MKVIERVLLNNIPYDSADYGHATGYVLHLDEGFWVTEYEGNEGLYEEAENCIEYDEDEYYGNYENEAFIKRENM